MPGYRVFGRSGFRLDLGSAKKCLDETVRGDKDLDI